MFDLPVGDEIARRNYSRFRTALLKEGFTMLQYSVYARYFRSEERSEAYRKRIKQSLPPEGDVRLITITDHQYGKMDRFLGRNRQQIEEPPEQLMLF